MSDLVGSKTFRGSRFVTDGLNYGTVGYQSAARVVCIDERCNKQFSIAIDVARPMTEEEVVVYYSQPAAGDPSPEEIKAECLSIQAEWTPTIKRKRRRLIEN